MVKIVIIVVKGKPGSPVDGKCHQIGKSGVTMCVREERGGGGREAFNEIFEKEGALAEMCPVHWVTAYHLGLRAL